MNLKRKIVNLVAGNLMLAATLFSGLLVIAIGLALFLRSRPIFASKPLGSLIFGSTWLPSSGQFGLKPFIAGTFWVTGFAVAIAVPVCLLASIYLAEYAGPRTRAIIKPLVDLLAGIPSVVYGVWGVLVVVPFVADTLGPYAAAHWKSIPLLSTEFTTGFSILTGGLVLAVMIFPVIVSVSEEVLRGVPAEYREVSYAVGATRLETVMRVVIRKALPGLVASVVLGVSRALGETMAVLMVVGNVPGMPKSIFDPAYPLPALIANNYGEMMSIPLYDSALLGAAFLLFVIILFFNIIAQFVLVHAVRRAV
ncbi:MAG TPA: phosphate ABC transporter permease subunit PstC [Armatimonadota bacterium]